MTSAGRQTLTALALAVLMSPAYGGADETTAEGSTIMTNGLPSDAAWARVLERFHDSGGIRYAELAASPEDLEAYLEELAVAEPGRASREDRIAFWCNAYNAVTLKSVLDRYPGVESVKEIDGFFAAETWEVAGESLTLDAIEDRALAEGDPRVHFAVVCASTSCPDLRFEPYRGADLDRQLEDQTKTFLADESKGMRLEGDELYLSSIFKWYAGDFTGGSTVVAFFARGKVLDWIVPYLPAEQARRIEAVGPSIRYLDYDWSLNDR